MTRLCGLNPTIDYTPVKWALSNKSVEAETTLTAYEGLAEDERAILVLLNGACVYHFRTGIWSISIDHMGEEICFIYHAGMGYTLKEFIGYFLDHGNFPWLEHIELNRGLYG